VIDLFHEWDTNGDGTVTKKEFRKAMPVLGFDAPKEEVDALFDQFDNDGSGLMGFKELQKMLKGRPATEGAAKPQKGKAKGSTTPFKA